MLIVSMNGAKQGKYQLQHNGIQAVFLTPKIERLFRKKNIEGERAKREARGTDKKRAQAVEKVEGE